MKKSFLITLVTFNIAARISVNLSPLEPKLGKVLAPQVKSGENQPLTSVPLSSKVNGVPTKKVKNSLITLVRILFLYLIKF